MSESIDKLIKEVSDEHGIVLEPNDPLIILQIINARLLKDSQKAHEKMLEHSKQQLEEIISGWSDETQEKAEHILNTSLSVSKEELASAFQEGVHLLHQEVENTLTQIKTSLQTAQRILMWCFAATALTLLAIAVVVYLVVV